MWEINTRRPEDSFNIIRLENVSVRCSGRYIYVIMHSSPEQVVLVHVICSRLNTDHIMSDARAL